MTPIYTPEELVQSSGNSLTIRVRDFLQKNDWNTTLSSYYVDTLTNKSRENDIIAIKNFTAKDAQDRNVFLSVVLVIECKYITKNTVFWFDPINVAMALNSKNSHNQNTNYFGIHTLSQNLDGNNKTVAKLFEDKDNGPDKVIYNGIDQCLHGLIAGRERLFGSNKYFGKGRIFLEFPVLLVSGFDQFYTSKLERITENFLFEIDYSYRKNAEIMNEYFLVDVVSEKLLTDYLGVIDSDIYTLRRPIEMSLTDEIPGKFGI